MMAGKGRLEMIRQAHENMLAADAEVHEAREALSRAKDKRRDAQQNRKIRIARYVNNGGTGPIYPKVAQVAELIGFSPARVYQLAREYDK